METTPSDSIWDNTFGTTLDIKESEAAYFNGLSTDTAKSFEEASDLSDDQIWEKIQKNEL